MKTQKSVLKEGDGWLRKLYIYCSIMLGLIVTCAAFLLLQPKLLPLADAPPNRGHPNEIAADSDDCPEKLSEAIQKNSDVYAWLHIPGTNVDYPIVQHPTNDAFYLKRNVNGDYAAAGSIMTEHSYNSTTFEDPVTVVYGQCMKSGAMFGNLQSCYASADGLECFKKIEVYLSDRKLEYEVFAAVPYDNRHILYSYDFNNPRVFRAFFQSIEAIRSLNANARGAMPDPDDKVLILSTRLHGDGKQRFLVMAKLIGQ